MNSPSMVLAEETAATSHISFLQCSECGSTYSAHQLNTYASCSTCERVPLLARYNLQGIRKSDILAKERSMWRYLPLLPVLDRKNIVTLGEGWTPLLTSTRLASRLNLATLYIKDESLNPTGSFKARGLCMAVSKAKELGIENLIIPTAGNAGGAMAAYCAKAGMKATVVMPSHTPNAFQRECTYFGANLILIDGLISDCAKKVAELNSEKSFFDLSTFKEPYRLEGKKTMGYEIAEQLNWVLPDVIFYPTGGGTGLVGMWKAFLEMIELGWIENKMPRFIAVQSELCKPVVETFFGNTSANSPKATMANGLAVPTPFAMRLIQRVLEKTSGSAIAVSEMDIAASVREIASLEGILMAPEGAALLAALKRALASGEVTHDQNILLLNTGSAYKYFENL